MMRKSLNLGLMRVIRWWLRRKVLVRSLERRGLRQLQYSALRGLEHPVVSECCVLGLLDKAYGEACGAKVALHGNRVWTRRVALPIPSLLMIRFDLFILFFFSWGTCMKKHFYTVW